MKPSIKKLIINSSYVVLNNNGKETTLSYGTTSAYDTDKLTLEIADKLKGKIVCQAKNGGLCNEIANEEDLKGLVVKVVPLRKIIRVDTWKTGNGLAECSKIIYNEGVKEGYYRVSCGVRGSLYARDERALLSEAAESIIGMKFPATDFGTWSLNQSLKRFETEEYDIYVPRSY
jgi:hypothetical protein